MSQQLPVPMMISYMPEKCGLVYMNNLNAVLQKLSLVNGVIFTGGRAKRGVYIEVVESIFKVHAISDVQYWLQELVSFPGILW